MQHLFLKNVRIIDKASPLNGQEIDALLVDGCLERPDSRVEQALTIQMPGLCLSKGWFDLRAHLCEPGLEHKDTLATLAAAAHAGGFTDLATLPNTQPTIEDKSALAYLRAVSASLPVRVHPMAAATRGAQGHEMTELLDLHHAGAVAFSDGLRHIGSAGVLRRLLQYAQHFNGLLVQYPEDAALAEGGEVHEGYHSTTTGMRGVPAMAETVAMQRDLAILAYTGGRLHFGGVSSAAGVEVIRKAKSEGLPVTADVAVANLVFTHEAILNFDTNMKVRPPLRSQADQDALWAGLADGTLDAIASNHSPQDSESKELEFNLADFGMLALETAFAALQTFVGGRLALPDLVHCLTDGPRSILGQTLPPIDYGQQGVFTLFQTEEIWIVGRADIKSPSANSPFFGQKLKGRPLGTVFDGQWHPISR